MSAHITPEDIGGRYFDHIVVGGGTAGCVVAARLSERGDRDVLLLEAGAPDTDPDIFAPRGVFHLYRGEYDWCDVMVAQPRLGGREVPISAGRVLGGGGSINYLAWYRGHRLDYDGWAANGMPGWGWSDVLPQFRRSEDHELGASPLHRTGGPIPVTTAKSLHPMSLALIAAGVEAGLPFNRDFTGADLDGVGLLYSNVGGGERVSAARGYLDPVRNRPNLTVHTRALVQRVVLHRGAARGVVFTAADGREVTVRGSSVVLCAGPLRSPQILMLSGIGPARDLRELGLDVAWDLPGVGANLRDHPAAVALWPVVDGLTWPDDDTPDNRQRYADQRRGSLASFGEAGGFLRCAKNAPAPDVELTPMLMDFTGGPDPMFSCLVTLLKPESRGTLRLRSTDPSAKPVLDPRYLDCEADHDLLVEGLRRTLALCSAPVMRAYLGEPTAPDSDTDEALSRQVRDNLISMNHPAGTCRAGTDGDSVVDPTLKVHGIDGLHVVDSSVMPDLPRGNTHAPSVMIGERGADLRLDAESAAA